VAEAKTLIKIEVYFTMTIDIEIPLSGHFWKKFAISLLGMMSGFSLIPKHVPNYCATF